MMKSSAWDMEAFIRRHLVCWYSPQKQGVTNESLADDPRLIDLSGNGHDLNLHGFLWTPACGVASDGGLAFNGNGAYGITEPFGPMRSFTYMVRRSMNREQGQGLISKKDLETGEGFYGDNTGNLSNSLRWSVALNQSIELWSIPAWFANIISWMTPNSWNGNALKGEYTDTVSPLYIGRNTKISTSYGVTWGQMNGVIYDVLLFDVELTAEQRKWVTDNMIMQ